MSAALVILVILAFLRLALIYIVVIVGLASNDPGRRRTALAMLRILRPLAARLDTKTQ